MKLKIIYVDSNSESESDYETAVDMSHSNIYTVEYKLKTLSGLELTLHYTNIETSYSYYEEDIPDNFKAGDQVSYSHHSSPDKHNSSEYGHMEAILNEKLVVLTKEEFVKYFNNYVEKSESEKYRSTYDEDIPNHELNKKFYQFEQQQKGYTDYENVIGVGGLEDVSAMMEKISGHKKDVWFDVELPESLKAEIESLDKKNQEINSHNSNNKIDSMYTQANARLSILCEKLAEEAKVALSSSSKTNKLKM